MIYYYYFALAVTYWISYSTLLLIVLIDQNLCMQSRVWVCFNQGHATKGRLILGKHCYFIEIVSFCVTILTALDDEVFFRYLKKTLVLSVSTHLPTSLISVSTPLTCRVGEAGTYGRNSPPLCLNQVQLAHPVDLVTYLYHDCKASCMPWLALS